MADRYLLFAGEQYYPGGGWKDYKMDFPSVESARNAVEGLDDYDWWQVVDSQTRTIVTEANKDLSSNDWEIRE